MLEAVCTRRGEPRRKVLEDLIKGAYAKESPDALGLDPLVLKQIDFIAGIEGITPAEFIESHVRSEWQMLGDLAKNFQP